MHTHTQKRTWRKKHKVAGRASPEKLLWETRGREPLGPDWLGHWRGKPGKSGFLQLWIHGDVVTERLCRSRALWSIHWRQLMTEVCGEGTICPLSSRSSRVFLRFQFVSWIQIWVACPVAGHRISFWNFMQLILGTTHAVPQFWRPCFFPCGWQDAILKPYNVESRLMRGCAPAVMLFISALIMTRQTECPCPRTPSDWGYWEGDAYLER